MKFAPGSLKMKNPTEPGLPPDELIDRTFLMPPTDNGTRLHTKIIERVEEHKANLMNHPNVVKFKCRMNDDYEEIVAYNDIVDYIEQDGSWDGIWKFKEIKAHKKVKPLDPDWKGCWVNVQVEWETGEVTWAGSDGFTAL